MEFAFTPEQVEFHRSVAQFCEREIVPIAGECDARGEVPLHERYGPEARYAVEAEALIPTTKGWLCVTASLIRAGKSMRSMEMLYSSAG